MPPPGQRYVAATWIAVGGAAATVLVGSTVVLAVRDSLPHDIVVRWDDLEPETTVSLPWALVLGAALTIVSCLTVLGAGVAVHRSSRHGYAGYAAGLSLALGLGFYATTAAQAWPRFSDAQPLMIAGVVVGWVAGWRLTKWVREPATADSPVPPAVALADLPPTTRLMWSGSVPTPLRSRLAVMAVMAVPLVAFYWWMGLPWWLSVAALGGAALGRGFFPRSPQLAIDYSGIGLRGKSSNLPSPIYLANVHSAEVAIISPLRDFGGWGRVTAPDGRQGWITRSGEALVVHRHDKPDFVFTVDGADEAAAVLNTLVARLRAQTFLDLPHPYGDRMPTPSD
jgi:hypothetical protein